MVKRDIVGKAGEIRPTTPLRSTHWSLLEDLEVNQNGYNQHEDGPDDQVNEMVNQPA